MWRHRCQHVDRRHRRLPVQVCVRRRPSRFHSQTHTLTECVLKLRCVLSKTKKYHTCLLYVKGLTPPAPLTQTLGREDPRASLSFSPRPSTVPAAAARRAPHVFRARDMEGVGRACGLRGAKRLRRSSHALVEDQSAGTILVTGCCPHAGSCGETAHQHMPVHVRVRRRACHGT